MKLIVCIPHATPYVVGPWYHRITQELTYPEEYEFLTTYSMPIETARNYMVDKAYYGGASHVLFIDDDIWPFKKDAVTRLINSGKNIIGGLCRYRTPEKKYVIFPQELQDGKGVVEVSETGCGFLLINIKVFEAMAGQYPFSDIEFFKWSGSTRAPNGEDTSFCRAAKKIGYKIYIDRDVKCGHHDTIIYDDSERGFSVIRSGKKDGSPYERMESGRINNESYENKS